MHDFYLLTGSHEAPRERDSPVIPHWIALLSVEHVGSWGVYLACAVPSRREGSRIG